jgi:hypothetical protein
MDSDEGNEGPASKRPKIVEAAEVLLKYHKNVRPDKKVDTILSNCYGEEIQIPESIRNRDHCWIATMFLPFLSSVGWVATHLMLNGFINEAIIRQSLDTVIHPKHWDCDRRILHYVLPSWPEYYKPQTEKERDLYTMDPPPPDCTDQKDPDEVIRAAADAGAYLTYLAGPGQGFSCFTGALAARDSGDSFPSRRRRSKTTRTPVGLPVPSLSVWMTGALRAANCRRQGSNRFLDRSWL